MSDDKNSVTFPQTRSKIFDSVFKGWFAAAQESLKHNNDPLIALGEAAGYLWMDATVMKQWGRQSAQFCEAISKQSGLLYPKSQLASDDLPKTEQSSALDKFAHAVHEACVKELKLDRSEPHVCAAIQQVIPNTDNVKVAGVCRAFLSPQLAQFVIAGALINDKKYEHEKQIVELGFVAGAAFCAVEKVSTEVGRPNDCDTDIAKLIRHSAFAQSDSAKMSCAQAQELAVSLHEYFVDACDVKPEIGSELQGIMDELTGSLPQSNVSEFDKACQDALIYPLAGMVRDGMAEEGRRTNNSMELELLWVSMSVSNILCAVLDPREYEEAMKTVFPDWHEIKNGSQAMKSGENKLSLDHAKELAESLHTYLVKVSGVKLRDAAPDKAGHLLPAGGLNDLSKA